MTHRQHYEKYRAAKLSGIAQESHFTTRDGQDPMMAMEGEKREHEAKLGKMKADMEAVFAQKVALVHIWTTSFYLASRMRFSWIII